MRFIFVIIRDAYLFGEQRWFIENFTFFFIEIIQEINLDFFLFSIYKENRFFLAYRYSKSLRKGHPLATCISASPAQIHPSHTATNNSKCSLLGELEDYKIWSNSVANATINRCVTTTSGSWGGGGGESPPPPPPARKAKKK